MTATSSDLPRPLADRQNLEAGMRLLPEGCRRFMADHGDAVLAAPGSGAIHQAWPGGYADHLDECFAVAQSLYSSLSALRRLPFEFADVLLVLFLHDAEKAFKRLPEGLPRDESYERAAFDQRRLQSKVIRDYDLTLTSEQENALRYIHGEGDDYRKDAPVAGPLAAFCHLCDYWSARGWPQEPATSGALPELVHGIES